MFFGIREALARLRRPIDRLLFNRMGRRGLLVAGEARSLRGRARVKGQVAVAAGEENLLELCKDAAFDGRLDFGGTRNVVELGRGSRFQGSVIISGQGNRLLIGAQCCYNGRIFIKGSGQTVIFGDHSTATDVYILCGEGTDVRIGRWCMLSRNIEIRSTDAHSLIDRETRVRTNLPASVEIGDHVWIGVGAIINKGAAVPADSVVGALSFVNGRFDEQGVVLAGTPARIVKRGITWNRAQKPKYSAAQLDHWKT